MVIAGVIAFCIALFLLAILLPRLSRGPERAGDGVLSVGQRGAGKAPGRLGRWLSKPFSKSRRAVRKSGSKGRGVREKLPL